MHCLPSHLFSTKERSVYNQATTVSTSNMNCTISSSANAIWQPNAGDITNLIVNIINTLVASASLYIAWLTYRAPPGNLQSRS